MTFFITRDTLGTGRRRPSRPPRIHPRLAARETNFMRPDAVPGAFFMAL
ncbi:hypothetical protein HMPREF0185_00394 [Brevundimonas diminuta 470-4]|nr:hypothetical protein HMPREF0185_00394 [Brevundimonas diminuta 470-4]